MQASNSRAQADISNSVQNNMESDQGRATPQMPNNITDQPDQGTNPSAAETQANNEVAGIEELRKRFTAIESKIAAVNSVFGFQRLTEAAEEEDSDYDSDDSAPFNGKKNYFLEVIYFMHNARIEHQREQSRRKARRNLGKVLQGAVERQRLEIRQLRLGNQTMVTAFLESKPATVTRMSWDQFIQPKAVRVKSLMHPIDVVIGEPDREVIYRFVSIPNPIERGYRSRPRGPEKSDSAEVLVHTSLPERIRINSIALQYLLRQSTDIMYSYDKDVVFLRPFKQLLYFEKDLRDRLNQLEERFENWDGSRDTSVKEADDATAEKRRGTEPQHLNTIDIKGEKMEEDNEDGTPNRPERPRWDDHMGETEDERDFEEIATNSITALLHLRCLMKFVDDEIKPKLRHIESHQCRKILFHDLWHLFKPGNEVIDPTEKQAYRIIRVQTPRHGIDDPWMQWYKKPSGTEDEKETSRMPMVLHCAYIDFDGKQLGPVSVKFSIQPFRGLKDIKSLPIYPLRFAKDTNLRDTLIVRGKMLLNIARFKPMYYTGVTLCTRDEIDSQVVVDFSEALADERRKEWRPNIDTLRTELSPENELLCGAPCCADDSVENDRQIDSILTQRFIHNLVRDPSPRPPSIVLSPRSLEDAVPGTDNEPTEDELAIMTYRVFGFVLRSRKWAQLDLTLLKYENPDARSSALSAFERLELPEGHREMVKSLVTQHFRSKALIEDSQTDLVRGKGKGLILLLHGAPGVGKTTTAEGVAELFEKPLFQITCGDLGTTAREVEQELEKNFALASRWGCILLLDEADVFLSARERKDFERNGLVAVFLRVLEYYTGILFLTTNRIGDFDEAFASRIHMSLYYPELDEFKTKRIFKLNLDLIQERFDKQGRKITYDVTSIEDFATKQFNEHPYSRWNGRQIRNVCQTALALAEFDAHGGRIKGEVDKKLEVKLQLKQFQLVQTAYLDFGRYLGDIRGTPGDRRAIDYGFRARSNTPYQTTTSRFSTTTATGMRNSHHLSPPSAEYNTNYGSNYGSHYQFRNTQNSDQFYPLATEGGPGAGFPGPRAPSTEHQRYEQYGPPQGQMGSDSGHGRYESPQVQGYTPPGNQQGRMDPRQYPQHQPSPQSQNWVNFGPSMSQGYIPTGLSQEQGPNFQSQTPQAQHHQGQPQYNSGNVLRGGVGVQNPMMYGMDSTVPNQYSRAPGAGTPEGSGPGQAA